MIFENITSKTNPNWFIEYGYPLFTEKGNKIEQQKYKNYWQYKKSFLLFALEENKKKLWKFLAKGMNAYPVYISSCSCEK